MYANFCMNLILGQAKMVINITRRNTFKNQPGTNVVVLFPALVKA